MKKKKAQAVVTAPTGTTTANVTFVGTASKGTIFYLDDIAVTN